MSPILEVCVDSLASARCAVGGGADRLELCNALPLGGLTPYTALLKQIRSESDIHIRCLIRPRAGDFLYTQNEIEMMVTQIGELRAAGADGFVIGCLTKEGDLDLDAMRQLIAAAEGSPLTLHRCIDVSKDPSSTYLLAAELCMDTVLTSGAANSCLNGAQVIDSLLNLRDLYQGPEVLIGAGVSTDNIRTLLTRHPTARAFHASCKEMIESKMQFRRTDVAMGLPGLDEWHIQQTSQSQVRILKESLM